MTATRKGAPGKPRRERAPSDEEISWEMVRAEAARASQPPRGKAKPAQAASAPKAQAVKEQAPAASAPAAKPPRAKSRRVAATPAPVANPPLPTVPKRPVRAKAKRAAQAAPGEGAPTRTQELAPAAAPKTSSVERDQRREIVAPQSEASRAARPSAPAPASSSAFWSLRPAAPGGRGPGDALLAFERIAAETAEYSRRSVETGSAFLAQFMSAPSLENASRLPYDYARKSCVDFFDYLAKVGAQSLRAFGLAPA